MAAKTKPWLILASGSPRRRQLLTAAGVSFRIAESGVIEELREGEGADEFALRMAREKALAVSRADGNGAELVLAADTVVECEGQILGKPGDAAEARAMLERLSGRRHVVITAFAIARAGEIIERRSVLSRVRFRTLGATEIEDYIASGEPFDKAGAYGIQGAGGGFIIEVEGSRDNVMGLPTREVLAALELLGIAASKPA